MSSQNQQPQVSDEQIAQNIVTAQKTFQKFAEEFRAAGYIVGENYGIDPNTGQILFMSVSSGWDANHEVARGIFTRLAAANVSIGIGSTLRMALYDGVNSGKIKLHDFGFRGRAEKVSLTTEQAQAAAGLVPLVTVYENGNFAIPASEHSITTAKKEKA